VSPSASSGRTGPAAGRFRAGQADGDGRRLLVAAQRLANRRDRDLRGAGDIEVVVGGVDELPPTGFGARDPGGLDQLGDDAPDLIG
jgi:hypothetical protein